MLADGPPRAPAASLGPSLVHLQHLFGVFWFEAARSVRHRRNLGYSVAMPVPLPPRLPQSPRPHALLALGEGLILLCLALLVVAGCTSSRPAGRTQPQEREARNQEAVAGETRYVFLELPTNFAPVQVSQEELHGAVTELMLHVPLRLGQVERVYPGRPVAQVTLLGPEWQSPLVRDYRLLCEERRTPGDCLKRPYTIRKTSFG